jgi:hypothetical protein
MPFDPQTFQLILARITERLQALGRGPAPVCPICGTSNWTVADGIATTQLTYGSSPFVPPANQISSLVIICQQCGNTIFLNLLVLGLGELVGLYSQQD